MRRRLWYAAAGLPLVALFFAVPLGVMLGVRVVRRQWLRDFAPAPGVVVSADPAPSPCCEVAECAPWQPVPLGAPACGDAVRDLLAGPCDGGCAAGQQRCAVRCGTCFAPQIVVMFSPDGGLATEAARCGRDDHACVKAFFAAAQLGTRVPGFLHRGQWFRGFPPMFPLREHVPQLVALLLAVLVANGCCLACFRLAYGRAVACDRLPLTTAA